MHKITLTVILTSYNYSKYIARSIRALLAQTYQPFELIIVDDASEDNSLSIIQEETKNCSFKKIIVHKKNLGVNACLNEACSIARGDFVYGAAADDITLPYLFEKSMAILEKWPTVGIFCSNIGISYDENRSITEEIPQTKEFLKKEYILTPKEVEKTFRRTKLTIQGATAIYKREFFLKYGGLNNNLNAMADWYLAHKIALNHGLVYIPEILVWGQRHKNSYGARCLRLSKRRGLNNAIINEISKEDLRLQKSINRSILLIQLGVPIIFSLFFHPRQWKLLPLLLFKKTKNIIFFLKHIIFEPQNLRNLNFL